MNDATGKTVNFDIYDRLRRYDQLLGGDVDFAFQTIIDAQEFEVVGFEALVRGIHKEPAAQILSRIGHAERFDFDQACRVRAIQAAAEFGIDADLHLNAASIKPGNVDEVVEVTRHLTRRHKVEPERIVFELSNLDAIGSAEALERVHDALSGAGFRTLADNFGQRDADLRPLAIFRPDMIKLDHRLVEHIHERRTAQATAMAAIAFCRSLGIEPMAMGVESADEFRWLQTAGIRFYQGYFFAQPGMNSDSD
ncbi:EAL domain-containing protein [Wenzhouxiangella marina]|uniref:Diguanylate phosphodiesterase n=1 Tax=Wenzhouxiangella marina TaxID=1579979 RepID=A0A0K0XXB3_9GAMM|nr:EAL domain-containing protein [Wenzhouxiangella marina]AKS42323.1 diguanylate phosphodiesterase [Wenzhouxiangella marina]MBB6085904.1 EAL domain-containing protein (putative c-di-GMP-specific phosphodiesterase class I) [Wenzhouxiangella marina]